MADWEVTLWSKTATKRYMPVDVEIAAHLPTHEVLMVLTRPDGMSMAVHLSPACVVQLAKDLALIQRRFKATPVPTTKE